MTVHLPQGSIEADGKSVGLDTYFNVLPIPASVVDRSRRVVAVNDAFCALFNIDRAAIIGQDIATIYPVIDHGWVREIHRRLFAGHFEQFRSTRLFATATGHAEQLIVVMSPVYGYDHAEESTGPTAVASIATYDFAPAPKLPMSEGFMHRVLAEAPTTQLVIDRLGKVIHMVGSARAGLEYPEGFWHDRNLSDIVVADDQSRLRSYLATLAERSGPIEDVELRVHAADGGERVLLVSGIDLTDDPVVASIVLSVQDVSELHGQITTLVEETRTAELLAEQRADLIATVSHELRNPLHALQGLSELLAGADLAPELKDVADELNTQLVGLATVTSDLLEAAKADRGEISLRPEPVSLETLLARAVRYGEAAVGAKPISVSGVLEPNSPSAVMLDPPRVDQIVRNLVGNAAKFTDSGSITITLGPVPQGIRLAVADTGPGIPGAELAKVLEPFSRGSNTTEATGAGLGLAIVNSLVRSMDGTIEVSSVVGEGATFVAEIKAPRSVATQQQSHSADDTATLGADVLVVDDDRINRVVATGMLERLGCRVIEAHSGEHALELLERPIDKLPVDVVLMDRRMPGMDGLDTTRALRRLSHRAGVYVVALTASNSPEEQAECADATMDDFVAKPASVNDIRRAVTAALEAQGRVIGDDSGQVPVEASSGPSSSETAADGGDATESSPAIVDRDRVNELVEEFDDVDLVRNLLEMFVAELPGQLEQIAGAQSTGDNETASRVAHTIKGSAAMLGAPHLAKVAKAAELVPDDSNTEIWSVSEQTIEEYQRILGDEPFGGRV